MRNLVLMLSRHISVITARRWQCCGWHGLGTVRCPRTGASLRRRNQYYWGVTTPRPRQASSPARQTTDVRRPSHVDARRANSTKITRPSLSNHSSSSSSRSRAGSNAARRVYFRYTTHTEMQTGRHRDNCDNWRTTTVIGATHMTWLYNLHVHRQRNFSSVPAVVLTAQWDNGNPPPPARRSRNRHTVEADDFLNLMVFSLSNDTSLGEIFVKIWAFA